MTREPWVTIRPLNPCSDAVVVTAIITGIEQVVHRGILDAFMARLREHENEQTRATDTPTQAKGRALQAAEAAVHRQMHGRAW